MQSKQHSIIEAIVNTFAGLALNVLLWYAVLIPVFAMTLQVGEVLGANVLITVLAVVKTYVIRRLFNNKTIKENSGC